MHDYHWGVNMNIHFVMLNQIVTKYDCIKNLFDNDRIIFINELWKQTYA